MSFPGVKSGRGVTLTPHPLLVPWSWKSRAIPLLSLWAVQPVQSLSACTKMRFTVPHSLRHNWGIHRVVGRVFLTVVDRLPCPVLPAIVPEHVSSRSSSNVWWQRLYITLYCSTGRSSIYQGGHNTALLQICNNLLYDRTLHRIHVLLSALIVTFYHRRELALCFTEDNLTGSNCER